MLLARLTREAKAAACRVGITGSNPKLRKFVRRRGRREERATGRAEEREDVAKKAEVRDEDEEEEKEKDEAEKTEEAFDVACKSDPLELRAK